MAMKPSLGALTPITVTGLSTLADTASVTADTEQDNVTDGFISGEVQCRFTAAGATTGSVKVYALVGLSTGNLSSTAKLSSARFLGSVELNGTTEVSKALRFEDMEAFFWKLHFVNSSGADLTAATVEFRGINYVDQ